MRLLIARPSNNRTLLYTWAIQQVMLEGTVKKYGGEYKQGRQHRRWQTVLCGTESWKTTERKTV